MENLDFFTYYPIDDLLVVYTFENDTLREDSIYGFEKCTSELNVSDYFWSVNWREIKSIVYRVLVNDFSLEEYKERFSDDPQFFAMNYEERYTIQDVLDQLIQFESEDENSFYY